MKKSLIYCRISLDNPLLQTNTLTNQRKRCRHQADKLKTTVLKIFSEMAKSDEQNREELLKLEAYIHLYGNEIDYLIVSDSLRMARSIAIANYIIGILIEYNIEFIDCNFPDLRGAKSYAHFLIEAEKGNKEKKNISENTSRAIQKIISDGRSWGRPAKGYEMTYDHKKKCLVSIDRDNKEIKRMFLLASQGYSIIEIQTQLQKEGYELISDSTLRFRLKNKKYAGYVKNSDGNWIRGDNPQIVDESLYISVQGLLGNKGKREKKRKWVQKNEYLPLRNWLLCKGGHHFTGSRVYYNCSKCKIHMKNEILHREFIQYLNSLDYVNSETVGHLRDSLIYIASLIKELKKIRSEIKEYIKLLNNNITKLNRQYLKASSTELDELYKEELIIYKDLMHDNNKRLDQIPHLSIALRDKIKSFPEVKQLSDLWLDVNFEDKTTFLNKIFPEGLFYNGSMFEPIELGNDFMKRDLNKKSNIEKIHDQSLTMISVLTKAPRPKLAKPKDDAIMADLFDEVNFRINRER